MTTVKIDKDALEWSIVKDADGYKYGHYAQTPEGTEFMYDYIEPRGGEFSEVAMVGLQPYLYKLTERVQRKHVDQMQEIAGDYNAPFNRSLWDNIIDNHDGRLPLEIRAVPEGTVVPNHNVLIDVVNTSKDAAWLTGFVETYLQRAWLPITVATQNFHIKRVLKKYLEETCDPESMLGLPFMLNDFGSRGVGTSETSMFAGIPHLMLFAGTDNTQAAFGVKGYYGGWKGMTVPAAEHSTITSWGITGEEAAYRNMLNQFGGEDRIVAVVSDSYNIWKAVDELWGGTLLEEVRAKKGRVVVRPDSGDPVTTPARVIEILMEKAGFTVNSKGYKVLPPYFRVIQGDGVDRHSIEEILELMKIMGIAAENIVFGMGGAMLQKLNRDTLKFAMKCSAICVNGEWRDVYKDPIDDKGKVSKKGRLELVSENGTFKTVRADEYKFGVDAVSMLETVFKDGDIVKTYTHQEVSDRLDKYL